MNITRATQADVLLLAEMNKRLIEDERHPNPMNVAQLAKRMTTWLKTQYTGYLAIEDEQAVAYCLFRNDGEYYYLRHLFVERTHRRQGVATCLLDWLYGNIWKEKPVRLDVLSHNRAAIAFYRAYGFHIGCLRMEK